MPPLAASSSGPGSPDYLLPEEVAKLLRLSSKSVYRLAAEDPTVPVLRLGRTVRFPRERLFRWLKAREQGPGRPRQRTREPVSSRAQMLGKQAGADPNTGPCANLCATEAHQKPGRRP